MGLWLVHPSLEGSRTMRTSEVPKTSSVQLGFDDLAVFLENDAQPHKHTPPTVGIIVCEGESTSTFVRAKLCLVKPTSHFPPASCRHRAPVLGITVSASSSNETGSENPLVTRRRTPCRRVTNLSPRARRAEIENSAPFHAANSRRSAGNIAGTLPINSCGIFVIGRRTCDNQLALPLHRSSSCPSRVSLSFSTSVMMRNPSTDSAARESSVNHANWGCFDDDLPTLSQVWNQRQRSTSCNFIPARQSKETHRYRPPQDIW